MDSQTFIKFLRILYTNYAGSENNKTLFDDVGGLIRIAGEYQEQRLIELLSADHSFTIENVGELYRASIDIGIEKMGEACIRFWKKNFSDICRSGQALSKWPKSTIKVIKKQVESIKKEEKFFNWLDLLWFSNQIEDEALKEKCIEKLKVLLNIENVTTILIGAHSTGAKELRSICVDFIVANGDSVEGYHKMKPDMDDLFPKGTITESLSNEVVTKVMNKTKEKRDKKEKLKECSFCGKSLGAFGNKKYTCSLCKRVACGDDINKSVTLPGVFGATKPKSICKGCFQLIMILGKEGDY